MGRSSVVISPTFSAETALNFWDIPTRYNVNTLWFVPTIMSILLQTDRGIVGQEFCQSNIKLCLCGTAPLSKNLRNKFETKYGLTIYENYGLSETFFLTTQSPNTQNHEGSVGHVMPKISISIQSDN